MLTHPTLDLLHQLGLAGMAKAFGEIEVSGEEGRRAKKIEPLSRSGALIARRESAEMI